MRYLLFFSVFVLAVFHSFAQESEKIFLNRKWKPVVESKAKIIREISKVGDDSYKVVEYNTNNDTLMTGEYSSMDPMIENGYFEFFDIEAKDKIAVGNYTNGEMTGEWTHYTGGLSKNINYDLDLSVKLDSSEEVVVVETMIKFEDKDMYAYRDYISAVLVYPPNPLKQGISGTSYIQFVVDKNGKVCNVEIAKSSSNKDLDREALRVISNSPKWDPVKKDGKLVNLLFTVPILFNLY